MNAQPEEPQEDIKYAKTEVVLKIRSHFVDSVLVGRYEEYHDNGELHKLAFYNSQGELDEEYFEFDRFGRCVLRYLYDRGKLEGMCERYGDNGKIKECGMYINNVLHGVNCYRQFYPNGRLKAISSYSHGVLHGESIYYTQKGTQTARHVYNHGVCPELSFK